MCKFRGKNEATQRPVVQHSTIDRVKAEKWPAVHFTSLYLDELLIQKCKFRDRFTNQILAWKGFPEGFIPPWRNRYEGHTCSEIAYRIIDVECIVRAKTLQLNLTDTVKTVPFRGETERITKLMWPPALQQHPGASLRFLFCGETDRITKWCDHQLCNSIQVRHYGFFFLSRRTESPNDVTTSYATASRCVTTVPFRGETDRITKWCDHQLCNSIQVHHNGSISWRDG